MYRHYEYLDNTDKEDGDGENVLHILRLIIKGDKTANKPQEDHLDPISIDTYVEQEAALKSVL